ncbi:MAG TPA: phosphodiester glycosidase family protein [Solirubrobacterales bacterium]|nr:phosphodiester glycosidase family protein [Solirubrobacterales bacterium]
MRLRSAMPPGLAMFLIALATTMATAFAATPAADAAEEGLPLINKTEQLGPGITLHHIKAVNKAGWYNEQVLTVDLEDSAVSTDLLTAGTVASGGPLSAAANKAGAVAATNGDFFDIGNSNAAEGGEIQGGKLVKSPDATRPTTQSFGVSKSGLAQLADLAVAANAEFGGQSYAVKTVNAANGGGVPANGMVAYTPEWGTYSRARGFTGVSAANLAEVLVVEGKVASIEPAGARAGEIPAGGFALVGRETAATALRTLKVGDPVELHYELSNAAAKELQFALGNRGVIVNGGKVVSGLETAIAPRTSVGFKDGGHTLVLATWDGPGGTGKGGVGIDREAEDMVAQGVELAVNLDGGGSTTMVGRALGDEKVTVRNNPSDGGERSDPNGIGIFVAPGNGQVEQLIVHPAAGDYSIYESNRVFPGMHRSLVARALDNTETPVPLHEGDVAWSSSEGGIENGVLAAPANATGPISIEAADGSVHAATDVRVLNPVKRLELSTERLSIVEPIAADAVTIAVTGRDDEGYSAPIEPQDLNLEYDHSVVEITPQEGKLKITPLANAGTILVIKAGSATVKLPITVGVQTQVPYSFESDANVLTRWNNNSTSTTTRTKVAEGLKEEFAAMRNVGISANGSTNRIKVAGQPLRIRLKLKSSIAVPSGLDYIGYYDGNGVSKGIYGSALEANPNKWQYATWELPSNTVFPITISSWQGINTNVAQQKAGYFILNQFEADVPTSIELPAELPLEEEPFISADGQLPEGGSDFQFATLSDVQFTAENQTLKQVATTAIHRIRQTNPDLIVLNGDITDRGLPQDLKLAREVLEEAGCELVPPTETKPADYTPAPGSEKVPCYYVPGNHESYGVNNVQETLANFEAQFGTPYRYFDHKGTRFILLASSLGTLRGSNWEQMPVFQHALESAVDDPSVHNVMVFDHHPVDDPSSTKDSQLGDREEVALVEKMLAEFREKSGKPVGMVGSHAQVEWVHQIEGVPYFVLTSSGKDPYGTPERGGFTGWSDWSVNPEDRPRQRWLTANVHAFAQSVTLNTPAAVKVGGTGQLSGSIVQPQGVTTGTRVVPLRYPMSVDWGGSANLAIGSGKAAIEAAREAGKVAILDPKTRILTGLHEGSVQVSVTNDSMRPYTGEASLAPITTQKTIVIAAAPTNTTAPTLSGSAAFGSQLSCSEGEWSGTPAPTLTYGWLRDGNPIDGADGSTYRTTVADAGHPIGCLVTAKNEAGEASAKSQTIKVEAAPQGCLGESITAAGSSLQAPAQRNLWSPLYAEHCPGGPTVDYQGNGSGPALASWGFEGGTFANTNAFVASDVAPNAAQIKAANAASGTSVLVVPVAQTAIGVVVNPPTGCEIKEITNKQLESVMRGNIKIWNKIQTATGAGCVDAPITRVVRAEGSGTTYQFKNYLSLIDEATLACTEGGKTWKQLEEIGTGEAPNTVWPENGAAGCSAKELSPLVTAVGGAGVVDAVNATEGAISYAALPDIEANKGNGGNPPGDTHWVRLQNNGVSNKLGNLRTASPVEGFASMAQCESTPYGVPKAAQSNKSTPANANWSTVLGQNPNMAGVTGDTDAYPLCTLTYDIALTAYSKAGFKAGQEQTAAAYLTGIVSDEGQESLETGKQFYAPLPTSPAPATDVLDAARLAVSKIGY